MEWLKAKKRNGKKESKRLVLHSIDKGCLFYHEDYGIWMVGRIVDLWLFCDCYYVIDYDEGDGGKRKVRPHNVRLYGEKCPICGDLLPGECMDQHIDTAFHFGYEISKLYLQFYEDFCR